MNDTIGTWIATPRGGVFTAADLRSIAELAMARGNGTLHLTSRAQILLPGMRSAAGLMAPSPAVRLERLVRGLRPNPVTTLPVLPLGRHRSWLTRRVYEEALAAIGHHGRIAVGLSDETQPYAPVAGSQLDFIASEGPHAWHVALANPADGSSTLLTGTVHTAMLGRIVERIATMHPLPVGPAAADSLAAWLGPRLAPHPASAAPFYRTYGRTAGLHMRREGGDGFFGVAMPEAGLAAGFVHDLCLLAQREGIVELGLTAWRTIVLHPVTSTVAGDLYKLMAAHGIAETPLWTEHWLPSPAAQATACPARLRSALGSVSTGSGGHSMGIVCRGESFPATDMVAVLESGAERAAAWPWSKRPRLSLYTRTKNADPTLRASHITEATFPAQMLRIMEDLLRPTPAVPAIETKHTSGEADAKEAKCGGCGMIYDDTIGDCLGGIGAGTPFESLAASWCCPVCGEPKEGFEAPAHASGF